LIEAPAGRTERDSGTGDLTEDSGFRPALHTLFTIQGDPATVEFGRLLGCLQRNLRLEPPDSKNQPRKVAQDTSAVVERKTEERRFVDVPEISNRPGPAPGISGRARHRPGRPAWSRRGVLAVLGAAVPALALSGCGDPADAAESADAPASGGAKAGTGTKAQVRTPAFTVTPADGARKAAFTSPVQVSVKDGTPSSVEVSADDGSTLAGSFDDGRTKWTSAGNPYSGTEYTVTARAEGGAEYTASFVTKSPGETFVGYFTPEANATSGSACPCRSTSRRPWRTGRRSRRPSR
jgi:hypothetical protein